jgi:hypothetical protein
MANEVYESPGVKTETNFENPISGALDALKLPVFIGEGSETLSQRDLEVVRGSSSSVDQQVVGEDQTGHAVLAVAAGTGQLTLGNWNGTATKFRVTNFPIVTGNGRGVTTNAAENVKVTVNGDPVIVRSVAGATGVVELAQAILSTDLVRCTYFFNRKDTLQTDDVSAQVSPENAKVRAQSGISDEDVSGTETLDFYADQLDVDDNVVVENNNVFTITVDGVEFDIEIPERADYTMAEVALVLSSASAGTLEASTFVNNFGKSALLLQADQSLSVGSGSANALLGFAFGQGDTRRRTFYTFNGPIVDGSNGGLTTTDPTKVLAKVDNVTVTVESVDGATRAVTLAVAPAVGASVKITYYHNTWQDTFDYLANYGITSVERVGTVPGSSDYIQGADFILRDDKIVWGTGVVVDADESASTSSVEFGSQQITATLIDSRTYLTPCTATTTSSSGRSVASKTAFLLPFTPTLGNGRATELGSSLFQTVANDRIDVPANRPDVVKAYWGFGVQDALVRGPVDVISVEGSTITLAEEVAVGATVYASFYYNELGDGEFTLAVTAVGASGTGRYTIADSDGELLYGAAFSTATKGSSLTNVTLEFPSGSELTPDVHFEGVSGADFTGPVAEVVTVQFAARDASPARYTFPGSGPYEIIEGQSDKFRVVVDSEELLAGVGGLDLSNPTTHGGGFPAVLVSDEIAYTGGTGSTVGQSYSLTATEEVNLNVDGVEITARVEAQNGVDIGVFVDALNEAANGHQGTAAGGTTTTITLEAAVRTGIDDYYNDWVVVIGEGADIGTATLANVSVADTITIAGVVFTAAGAPTLASQIFDQSGTDIQDATSLVAAINHAAAQALFNTALNGGTVTATNGGGTLAVVTLSGHPTTVTSSNAIRIALALRASAGQVRTVTDYVASTGVATVAAWDGGAVTSADEYRIYNPDTLAVLKGATKFNGSTTLAVNKHDKLKLQFTGDSGHSYSDTVDLGNGPFATAALLAAQVQSAIDTSVATAIGGDVTLAGLKIYCVADADGRLEFSVRLPGVDSAGALQFLTGASEAVDFCVLAGLDTAATFGAGQTILIQGPIAKSYEKTMSGTSNKPYDRLMLRNRIVPNAFGSGSIHPQNALDQMALVVRAGSGNTKAGLTVNDFGMGGAGAVVQKASLLGEVGFAGGMNSNAQPLVTFYDGSGTQAANDTFKFTLDGTAVTVNFTSTDTGTATPLGPAAGTSNGSVIDQIIDAMAGIAGSPFGANAAAVFAAGYVVQEGAGIRLVSGESTVAGTVVIGNGVANTKLGFTEGAAGQRVLVDARVLASALNEYRHTTFASWAFDFGAENASPNETFATLALADVLADDAGNEYLHIQSLGETASGIGAASIVLIKDPTVGSVVTDSVLSYNTGLFAEDGDGAVGEAALDGFFVVSSNPDGSGSINESVLNNGTGQDGIVGQTYRDSVTGLTFTVLPRGFNANPSGPWQAYPTGGNATFRFTVSTSFLTNANIPHRALGGVELKVANTANTTIGDTALVTTHERGGSEPSVGDLYYVSYSYTKEDFKTKFYSKQAAVERAFGALSPDNPLSLAAYLAFVNGAVVIGLKQVPRETGSQQASLTSYRAALDELEGPLAGNTNPDIITPLRGDSDTLFTLLQRSNAKMSSPRYESERTSIIGYSAGMTPDRAMISARTLNDPRMRVVYPDSATIVLEDAQGAQREHFLDGYYVAAALVGSVTAPQVDVATPWVGRRLRGFSRLPRRLTVPEMNNLAQSGMVVLEERSPFIRVRDAWTTHQNRDEKLKTLPEIQLIADDVQKRIRSVLDRFIGVKFLPGILPQIEGEIAALLKGLVQAQIIVAYTGIKATVDPVDPTRVVVSAFFAPVFPLLYVRVVLAIRSRL